MRLILHFFAIKEEGCVALPVSKSRLEEVNAGVGGVEPGPSAHSCQSTIYLLPLTFSVFIYLL